MTDDGMGRILDRLCGPSAAVQAAGDPPDGALLGRYVEAADGAAFAELVRRHGPMVLGVCRRLVGHEQDAEDAFQAAFLVLARKAPSVSPRAAVGAWLYGVARKTALKARALAARRLARETPVPRLPEATAPAVPGWDDVRPVLDAELARLPEKYRVVLLTCDVEGLTRAAAARYLRLSEGTVATRLARARARLAGRLTRRGVGAPAATLAALTAGYATAAPPAGLAASVVRVAVGLPTQTPAAVAAITEGVLRAMIISKLKLVAAGAVAVAGIALGGLAAVGQQIPGGPPAPGGPPGAGGPPRPTAAPAQVRPGNGVPGGPGLPGGPVDPTRAVGPDLKAGEVFVKGAVLDRVAAEERVVSVTFGPAVGGGSAGVFSPNGGTVTGAGGRAATAARTQLVNLPVANDAVVVLERQLGTRTARSSGRPLSELEPGMTAELLLTVRGGRLVVSAITGRVEPK